MKNTIKTSMFDVNKVEVLWTHEFEKPVDSDFYTEETLCKTKNGHFFLYAYGENKNCKNIHVVSVPNEKLTSLTKEEALKWCQKQNVSTKIIYEHFELKKFELS